MNLQRKTYNTRGEKIGDFVIGIGIWFGINIVLGLLVTFGAGMLTTIAGSAGVPSAAMESVISIAMLVVNCLPFVVNGAVLIYFAFTRHWIALGMAAAFGISLLLIICATVLFAGICFAALSGMPK